jgi:hypothetical protein
MRPPRFASRSPTASSKAVEREGAEGLPAIKRTVTGGFLENLSEIRPQRPLDGRWQLSS